MVEQVKQDESQGVQVRVVGLMNSVVRKHVVSHVQVWVRPHFGETQLPKHYNFVDRIITKYKAHYNKNV